MPIPMMTLTPVGLSETRKSMTTLRTVANTTTRRKAALPRPSTPRTCAPTATSNSPAMKTSASAQTNYMTSITRTHTSSASSENCSGHTASLCRRRVLRSQRLQQGLPVDIKQLVSRVDHDERLRSDGREQMWSTGSSRTGGPRSARTRCRRRCPGGEGQRARLRPIPAATGVRDALF